MNQSRPERIAWLQSKIKDYEQELAYLRRLEKIRSDRRLRSEVKEKLAASNPLSDEMLDVLRVERKAKRLAQLGIDPSEFPEVAPEGPTRQGLVDTGENL